MILFECTKNIQSKNLVFKISARGGAQTVKLENSFYSI